MSQRELFDYKRYVQDMMTESKNEYEKAYWTVVFRWIVAEIQGAYKVSHTLNAR